MLWESSDWWLRLDAVYFEEHFCCCSSKLDELLVTNPASSFRQIRKQNNCKSAQPTLPPGIRFSLFKETIWQQKWEKNYFCNNFWTILYCFTLIDSSLWCLCSFCLIVYIKNHFWLFEIWPETEFLKMEPKYWLCSNKCYLASKRKRIARGLVVDRTSRFVFVSVFANVFHKALRQGR